MFCSSLHSTLAQLSKLSLQRTGRWDRGAKRENSIKKLYTNLKIQEGKHMTNFMIVWNEWAYDGWAHRTQCYTFFFFSQWISVSKHTMRWDILKVCVTPSCLVSWEKKKSVRIMVMLMCARVYVCSCFQFDSHICFWFSQLTGWTKCLALIWPVHSIRSIYARTSQLFFFFLFCYRKSPKQVLFCVCVCVCHLLILDENDPHYSLDDSITLHFQMPHTGTHCISITIEVTNNSCFCHSMLFFIRFFFLYLLSSQCLYNLYSITIIIILFFCASVVWICVSHSVTHTPTLMFCPRKFDKLTKEKRRKGEKERNRTSCCVLSE